MSFWTDFAELAGLSGVSSLVLAAAADSCVRAQRERFPTSFLLKPAGRSRPGSSWPIIFGLVITLEVAAALLLAIRQSVSGGLAVIFGLVPPIAFAYARTKTPYWVMRLPLPRRRDFRGRPVPQSRIAEELIDSVSLSYTCVALALAVGALLVAQHDPRRTTLFQWMPTTPTLSPAAAVAAILLMLVAAYHVLLTILEGVGQIVFEMYRRIASFRSRLVALRWLWWILLAALVAALLIVRAAVSPSAQVWMGAAAFTALVTAHPFWNRSWTIRQVEGGNVPIRLELVIGGTLRILTIPAASVFYITTVTSHHPIRAAAVAIGVTIPFVVLIRGLPSWRPGKRLGAGMAGVTVLTPLLSTPTLTGLAGAASMMGGLALGFLAMTVSMESEPDHRLRPTVLLTLAFAATTALILLPVASGPYDAIRVVSLVAVLDLSVIYGGWLRRHAGASDFD